MEQRTSSPTTSPSLMPFQQPSPALSSPAASPSLSPTNGTPNRSRASSRASHLTLDLSCIPPLVQPSPPTNTLLITNLNNTAIFAQPHITQLRDIISQTSSLVSWSPLKSFRRIVCSFATTEDAIAVRQALDCTNIMGDRVRVYFGEHTPVQPVDQHLQAPESKKLFFISPPPSPPHGWEIKNEDPPNAVIVAEDLAHALAKLSCVPDDHLGESENDSGKGIGRPRSGSSVLLFEPEDASKPAISVDDYTDSADESSPVSPRPPLPIAEKTARPPVELMGDA